MSSLSLVAGDSEMLLSWDALSGFEMPVKDLKYVVIMNGSVVESGLEDVSYLKSELVNVLLRFIKFQLIELIKLISTSCRASLTPVFSRSVLKLFFLPLPPPPRGRPTLEMFEGLSRAWC